MIPGMTHWHSVIKSGDVTAITLKDGVPIAVGVAALDMGTLTKVAGKKGKAVYLVHCYHDELWALGSKMQPPTATEFTPGLETAVEELSLEPKVEETEGHVEDLEQETPYRAPEESVAQKEEPSTPEIDDAFKKAVIYGLYQIKTNTQSNLPLPLSSSTLVSTHLNPYLSEPFSEYNFKKTSWKKAAAFMKKFMEKEGLVKTKDRGGETVILSINWNHKLITEFEPYRLDRKENKSSNKELDSATQVPTIQIQELFKPTGKVLKSILEAQSKSYHTLIKI
jgi:translation initiation factor 2D